MSRGRSVRLYLAEGTATGIVTAEIVNWTGHAIAAPRIKLEDALRTREELRRTGVYILLGDDDLSGRAKIYIGEGDDIASRLKSHSKDEQKDFWIKFVAFTSKDMNLTKAHVKFLEGRLITIAKEAKKAVVANKTEPSFDKLPESDISDMETFLEEIQLILPVIGVDVFRRPDVQSSTKRAIEVQFSIEHKTKGILARAAELDGEFVVQKGAVGDVREAQSFSENIREMRKQAFESGRARKISQHNFELLEDIAFNSPSQASVFLFGTSRNGRTDWIVEGKNISYGTWKDQQSENIGD